MLNVRLARRRDHIAIDCVIDQVLFAQDVMKVGLVLADLLGPDCCNPFSGAWSTNVNMTRLARRRVHFAQDVMNVGLVLAGLLGPSLCNPFSV